MTSAIARNSFRLILQRLDKQGAVVAQALKVHPSKVSRFKNADMQFFCELLAEVGLKVVSKRHLNACITRSRNTEAYVDIYYESDISRIDDDHARTVYRGD